MHGDGMSAMPPARGTIADRPWGCTLGALGVAARTVQLTLRSDEKVYRIAFDRGVVIAASSPLAADAAVRIALTGHFITPALATDIKRRIAAAPSLDEVDVLAAAARLAPDQLRALRLRIVTQRAARTFSVDHGEYELEDRAPLPIAEGGIDVGSIIYTGVRMNLSEERLASDLRRLGTRFVLERGAADDLARFGFTRAEQPVIAALRRGTSLPELEVEHRDLDPRVAQSVIYALASCGALVPAEPLGRPAPAAPAPAAARAPTPRSLLGRAVTQHGPPLFSRAPTPRPPAISRAPTPRPPVISRVPTPISPLVSRASTPPVTQVRTSPPPRTPIVARAPSARPRSPALPPPVPPRTASPPAPVRTRTEDELPPLPGGIPRPVDPHTQPTARAAVSRSMLDAFRTGKTTTVRPNALAAHEVVALIEQRTALLDRGADHFALLGVPVGAPIEDIHAAYVELSRHLRPKRLAELGIADEGFVAQRLLAQIGIAFTVLTDRIRRSEYMASLQSAQRQQASGQS